MAQNDAINSENIRNSWYCHVCEDKTNISLPEYACSKCNSGFVEQMEEPESSHAGPSASSMQRVFVRSSPYMTSRVSHRSIVGRTRFSIRRLPPPAPGQENSFQDFMNHLIERVTGDDNETGSVNVGAVNVVFGPAATSMMMNQISGNLVIASAGIDRLDNIITMLLNQLDAAGTGPPPASKDEIDALPTVNVIQEQVDSNMQCIVCMEDLQLEEPVRSLPCKHIFHSSCIVPWLELHGTCPVCRRGLGPQSTSSSAASASPFNQNSRSRRYRL